ncbi:MAG: hypothetical protein MJ096_01075 [Clostridia bacterium]|nr:hypothetical protein [Clostridia bacterium]
MSSRSDLSRLSEISGYDRQTVSDALEAMLDAGLVTETREGDSFLLSDNLIFIVTDLSRDEFTFSLYHGGKPVIKRSFLPDGRYFFDENAVFFMREASLILKKEASGALTAGCAVILPENADSMRGTKSILKDRARLTSLASELFGTDNVITDTNLAFAKEYVRRSGIADDTLLCLSSPDGFICSIQSKAASVQIGRYETRETERFLTLTGAKTAVTDSRQAADEIANSANVEVITAENVTTDGAVLVLTDEIILKNSEYLEKDSEKWKNIQ